MPFGLDSRHAVSIARQPILDPKARVFGYQLLYECGPGSLESVDTAAACTLSEAILSIGVDPLSCGRPLFVPLTRSLLLGGAGSLLPPSTVLVLDEHINGDVHLHHPPTGCPPGRPGRERRYCLAVTSRNRARTGNE